MGNSNLNNLTVIGGGVLGGQIAWHSAFKGKNVVVYDINDEGIGRCKTAQQTYAHIYKTDLGASDADIQDTQGRLTFSTDLKQAVVNADVVIEAIPEIPDLKTKLYQDLAQYLPERTIVASNSSTLLPSQFAKDTGRPEKFCALHFANLIWALNVGEIMAHEDTSEETLIRITEFAIEIGMVPIPVEKEQNGYVLNSILVPIVQASQSLITNGVTSPEVVDRTYMILNRGCAMGPCGIIDVVGFKTIFDVFSYWGSVNNDEQMLANAKYIKENFLDKGMQGMQGGQGYYSYPNPTYQAASFLDVPDISTAKEIALKVKLK